MSSGAETVARAGTRLRILILNWLDRRNPQAGGAEIHLHEIFGRLAAAGHSVRLLASGWKGAPDREILDGIEVTRVGSRHGFPLVVRSAYRRLRNEGPIDVIVEDINKLPLFSPRWAREPVVALVPHLFGTTAFREASAPVASTVWAAERLMPSVYRNRPFQAISRSTADDLVRRGFDRKAIEVIYPGIDHDVYSADPGTAEFEEPTLVYVGRLKRYKGLDVVLRAVAGLAQDVPNLRLLIAGKGDDRDRLAAVAGAASVADRVEFLGYVSEERKIELLRRAWVSVYPSPKEGWGITNVEAAACGTPSVASDSPGLRESVAEGRSGFLVRHEDVVAWRGRLRRIIEEPELRARLRRDCPGHAAGFSWERAAEETECSLSRIHRASGEP